MDVQSPYLSENTHVSTTDRRPMLKDNPKKEKRGDKSMRERKLCDVDKIKAEFIEARLSALPFQGHSY